jgi:hypothetical protein
MSEKQKDKDTGSGQRISNLKLAIGAASLFLFIVGVKRSFRLDEAQADSADTDRKKAQKSKKSK